jgi:hypothetical protein
MRGSCTPCLRFAVTKEQSSTQVYHPVFTIGLECLARLVINVCKGLCAVLKIPSVVVLTSHVITVFWVAYSLLNEIEVQKVKVVGRNEYRLTIVIMPYVRYHQISLSHFISSSRLVSSSAKTSQNLK